MQVITLNGHDGSSKRRGASEIDAKDTCPRDSLIVAKRIGLPIGTRPDTDIKVLHATAAKQACRVSFTVGPLPNIDRCHLDGS